MKNFWWGQEKNLFLSQSMYKKWKHWQIFWYMAKYFVTFSGKYVYFIRNSRSQIFLKRSVIKNLIIFTGKQQRWSPFVIKLEALRPETLLKKRLQHRCFPVNISIFFKNSFFYWTPPVGVRAITLEENYPPVMARVRFRLGWEQGGGAIFLRHNYLRIRPVASLLLFHCQNC